jgi:hypothetical protein
VTAPLFFASSEVTKMKTFHRRIPLILSTRAVVARFLTMAMDTTVAGLKNNLQEMQI